MGMRVQLIGVILLSCPSCVQDRPRPGIADGTHVQEKSDRQVASQVVSEAPQAVPWGPESDGIKLRVWADRLVYRRGEPIKITWQVLNVTKNARVIRDCGIFPNHRFIVRHSWCSYACLTTKGEQAFSCFDPGGDRPKNSPVEVMPGERVTLRREFDLSRYFDLRQEDTYTVQVSYEEYDELGRDWSGQMSSNKWPFVVIAEDPE